MKQNIAKQITKIWNEREAGRYAATRTTAKIQETVVKGNFAVEIWPDADNCGRMFSHIEELNAISKVFDVGCYVTIQENIVIGRLF